MRNRLAFQMLFLMTGPALYVHRTWVCMWSGLLTYAFRAAGHALRAYEGACAVSAHLVLLLHFDANKANVLRLVGWVDNAQLHPAQVRCVVVRNVPSWRMRSSQCATHLAMFEACNLVAAMRRITLLCATIGSGVRAPPCLREYTNVAVRWSSTFICIDLTQCHPNIIARRFR